MARANEFEEIECAMTQWWTAACKNCRVDLSIELLRSATDPRNVSILKAINSPVTCPNCGSSNQFVFEELRLADRR